MTHQLWDGLQSSNFFGGGGGLYTDHILILFLAGKG